jgi:putative oxidoreductase
MFLLSPLDRVKEHAPLLLRLIVGVLMAYHGFQKTEGGGAGFIGFVGKSGIPAPTLFGWLAILAELVGGVFLVFGFLTRWSAIFVAFTMAVAVFWVHIHDGFGKQELPLVYLIASLTLLVSGAGPLSVDALAFRER